MIPIILHNNETRSFIFSLWVKFKGCPRCEVDVLLSTPYKAGICLLG